jgi:hypothetical protein
MVELAEREDLDEVDLAIAMLSPEARQVLYNRFSVMKSRARTANIRIAWATRDEWMRDVIGLLPRGFNPSVHRITYKVNRRGEYDKSSIVISRAAKDVFRTAERIKGIDIQEVNRRQILAVELSRRLLLPPNGQSFDEIIRDAMAAAGYI